MDSNQASDAELWARVRAGDGDAIAGLYDRYADRIHAYCFRRTGSLALAQDLTSTVWLEAWRNRGKAQVHQNGSLAPWLFGITHNVLRNSERAQRRYRAVLDKLPQPVDEPDQAELVSGRLDDEARMNQVLRAVERLPTHERDVLALVVWADLDHNQVASELNISVGTVKSRLSRARARLRSADPARPGPAPTTIRERTFP